MLKDLVERCRSYRRFYEEEKISTSDLKEIVNLGRLTASSANTQALKFKIVNEVNDNERVFNTIRWAAALPDWEGPIAGERPSAYIVIACDLEIAKNKLVDDGIVAQTMMLAATEKGYGGCMIGSFQRSELAQILNLDPNKYTLDLVLALGKPKETVKLVTVAEDGKTTYYRDQQQVHYVPKRTLEDVLL